MRDALAISFARRKRWWIAAGAMLLATVALAFVWSASERRREEVLVERLARVTAARSAAAGIARAEETARAHADALTRLGSLPLPKDATGAVDSARESLRRAGITKPRLESSAAGASGSIGIARVRIEGAARHAAVRVLLAELEERRDPIGWERFVFDGERISLEILLLHREGP